MNNKVLKVYDTITGKMVDVEVTPEVYREYMRTEWGIKNNNNSFYEHEIQFSALIGGNDDAYENFDEFIQNDDYEDTEIIEIFLYIYLYPLIFVCPFHLIIITSETIPPFSVHCR